MLGEVSHVESGRPHSPPPGERQAQGADQGRGHRGEVDGHAGDGGAGGACGGRGLGRKEQGTGKCLPGAMQEMGLVGQEGVGRGQEGAGPTELHPRAPRTPPLAPHVANANPDDVTCTWLRAREREQILGAAGDGYLGEGAGLPWSGA